jgi:hypothetical protein
MCHSEELLTVPGLRKALAKVILHASYAKPRVLQHSEEELTPPSKRHYRVLQECEHGSNAEVPEVKVQELTPLW